MDDGLPQPHGAVAQAFTPRQVMILRGMLAIMALTFAGGLALVGVAIFMRGSSVPPTPAAVDVRALASGQAGVSFAEGRLPAGAKLVSSHVSGNDLVLVYEDAGGTLLARFNSQSWQLTGIARLAQSTSP